MIDIARHPTEPLVVARYDRELHRAAVAALSNSKYTALGRLSCSVSNAVIEVSGTVSSFYQKQLAQAALMRLEHVESVRNLVEVSEESPVLVATSCEQGAG